MEWKEGSSMSIEVSAKGTDLGGGIAISELEDDIKGRGEGSGSCAWILNSFFNPKVKYFRSPVMD